MRRFGALPAYLWWALSIGAYGVFALWASANLEAGTTALSVVLVLVGAASVLWLPVRHAWAELAQEEESRRALAASAHQLVVRYRDDYYLPLLHRLQFVWGVARRCELWYESEPGQRDGARLPERLLTLLLHELARLESVQIWAHDSSVPFVFATERAEELVTGRWQALQIELWNIYGDTCDRDLSELIRRRFPPTLPGVEITAHSLGTVEYSWRAFDRRMQSPRQRQGRLWEESAQLRWARFTRMRVLARAAAEELEAALAPLNVDLERWNRRSYPRRDRSTLWAEAVWRATGEDDDGTLSVHVCSAVVLPSPEDREFVVRRSWYAFRKHLGSDVFDNAGLRHLEISCSSRPRSVIVESAGEKRISATVTDTAY